MLLVNGIPDDFDWWDHIIVGPIKNQVRPPKSSTHRAILMVVS